MSRVPGTERAVWLLSIGLILAVTGCDRLGSPHQRADRFLKSGDYAKAVAALDEAIAAGDHLDVAYANRCYARASWRTWMPPCATARSR